MSYVEQPSLFGPQTKKAVFAPLILSNSLLLPPPSISTFAMLHRTIFSEQRSTPRPGPFSNARLPKRCFTFNKNSSRLATACLSSTLIAPGTSRKYSGTPRLLRARSSSPIPRKVLATTAAALLISRCTIWPPGNPSICPAPTTRCRRAPSPTIPAARRYSDGTVICSGAPWNPKALRYTTPSGGILTTRIGENIRS